MEVGFIDFIPALRVCTRLCPETGVDSCFNGDKLKFCPQNLTDA